MQSGLDLRMRRLTVNEAFFRELNERLQRHARSWGDDDDEGHYEYLCECWNVDCLAPLSLTKAEYEAVRSSGAWFVVAPQHALLEVEDVVEEHAGYWIVEKRDEIGELAERLDPRG